MSQGRSNYYEVLRIDPSADPDTIKAAYRRLVRQYHPDVNHSPGAAARMTVINAAYAVLSDPAKRTAYDQEIGVTTAPAEASRAINSISCPYCGHLNPGSAWACENCSYSLYEARSRRAPAGRAHLWDAPTSEEPAAMEGETSSHSESRIPRPPRPQMNFSLRGLMGLGISLLLFTVFFGILASTTTWVKDFFFTPPTPTQPPPPTETPPALVFPQLTRVAPDIQDCVFWDGVTVNDLGSDLCVRGLVSSTATKDREFSIYFSESGSSFYLRSNDTVYPSLEAGTCVLARGKVELHNSRLAMKIGRNNPLYACPP